MPVNEVLSLQFTVQFNYNFLCQHHLETLRNQFEVGTDKQCKATQCYSKKS